MPTDYNTFNTQYLHNTQNLVGLDMTRFTVLIFNIVKNLMDQVPVSYKIDWFQPVVGKSKSGFDLNPI